MAENIIISNPEKLNKIKEAISRDGAGKLYVLADFDKTLTKAFVRGEGIVSLISILRDGNYLTPDYAGKAHALYDKYHAIEIDPAVPFEEKKNAMHEWWTTHFKLLIKSGLNKKDIKKAVESGKVEMREGLGEFAEILRSHAIPLVVLSSSGLGTDAISMYFEKEGKLYDNVYIVSNSFKWDKNGNAVGVKEPIMHSLNKSASAVKDFPFYDRIKERKNVLLLGDSIDDAGMIKGSDCKNSVKIGFLNENTEKYLEEYKKTYDIVILNDGSMECVNKLIKEMMG